MKCNKLSVLLVLSFTPLFARANTEASLDYNCELNQETRTGTVSIDEEFLSGSPSCMYFGVGKTICWRFERHIRIGSIYLALRYADQLVDAPNHNNFIQLGNIPFAEGATNEIEIKTGLFSKRTLKCTYSNVNWQ